MKQFNDYDTSINYQNENNATVICISTDGTFYYVWETGDILPVGIQNMLSNKYAPNGAIYEQLAALDQKSIRALREGDTTRLTQYETDAAALRAQLIK